MCIRDSGKTMLLSTVEHFFDPRYADQPEDFEQLRVWKDERSRSLFGKIPVISVSFGSCKGLNYKQAMQGMAVNLGNMYEAQDVYKRQGISVPICTMAVKVSSLK